MADPRFSHYFRPCPYDAIDVYRVLQIFGVSDPALQHAIKKLLVAGGRGHKDAAKDVDEAIVALRRYQEMREEEKASERNAAQLVMTPAPGHTPWNEPLPAPLPQHPDLGPVPQYGYTGVLVEVQPDDRGRPVAVRPADSSFREHDV